MHLADKHISGGIACLGGVKGNVSKVDDDLKPLRELDRRQVTAAMQKIMMAMMAHSA